MYTREQVLGMSAGPKLDRLIYEHVMGFDLTGFKWPQTGYGKVHEMFKEEPSRVVWVEFPRYSESIAAAWEVVEKLRENWFVNMIDCGPWGWRIDIFSDGEDGRNVICPSQKTLPEAACKSALLSLLKED